MDQVTRRTFLKGASTAVGAAAGVATGPWVLRSHAQGGPVKIGILLPYTGVYAELGESITQGMELVFARENWTVAGRKIEVIKEDDESKPPVGVRKGQKLIESDKVDIVVSDENMNETSGLQLLTEIRRRAPRIRLVLNSGMVTAAMREKAEAIGVEKILSKPFRLSDLVRLVAKGPPPEI